MGIGKQVGYFLKAVRFNNLLIIAFTQYLLRWCILKTYVEDVYGFSPEEGSVAVGLIITEFQFFLLVLSSVLVAAAGYIINDYFDLKIDRVNKPDKIIVGRYIKRRIAMGAHLVMTFLGILIGGYVAMKIGSPTLVLIHIFSALSLWFYSTSFKSQFLIGNLIIALLAGLVPLTIGLFEIPALNKYYLPTLVDSMVAINFNYLAYWVLGYAAFAFVLTLAREITKDIADIKGDENYGCRTIPIVIGVKNTKFILLVIYCVAMTGVIYAQQNFINDSITLWYMALGFGLVLLYTMFKTMTGETREDFLSASQANKLLSLIGILYMPVANFIFVDHFVFQDEGTFVEVVKYILGFSTPS